MPVEISGELLDMEKVNKLSFYDVNKLREKYKGNDKAQATLGAREHYLFMEDTVSQHPEAAIGAAAATIGYQAIKTTELGRELVKTTDEPASPASMEQLKGGLGGIASGLGKYMTKEFFDYIGIPIDEKKPNTN